MNPKTTLHSDLLIRAKWTIPVVPSGVVLHDYAVAIKGKKIVAICSQEEARAYPFGAAGLVVRCRYKDIVGFYPLTMPMSTDAAVIFGRELYGEPKKVAEINVLENDGKFVGTVQRYGVTYMEIQGQSCEILDGGDSGIQNRFYFKYMPAPDGVGFDNDPVLVRVRHTGSTRRAERLEGELILRESDHDPVADVPILDIRSVMYSEGDSYTHGEILDRVPGESFLPYMFGKVDDLELLAREGVVESE